MGIVPDIRQLLNASQLEYFKHTPDVTYICDSDLRLLACNPAWTRFALANGGREIPDRWGPGSSLTDAMSGWPRAYYRKQYIQALATGEVFRQEYECSSPGEERHFLQVAYPLERGRGLLITNSLVREESPKSAGDAGGQYVDHRGLIVQCSHCGRVAWPEVEGSWGWAPTLAGRTDSRISHSFCPWCLEHYHPA